MASATPAPPAPASPASPGPLAIRQVTLKAGGTTILSRVSLTLYPGELCGLIGPSGSGKSSLIRVLLGLRDPDPGEVRLGGKPVGSQGPVGYVPQDDALHTALSVTTSLRYAAELRLPGTPEKERHARVDELVRQVGLWERRDVRISRLSGGQRKRVSVALELLTSPALIILDEPTSGLDPGMEAHMMDLFAQVARSGRVVLVSTHAMESLNRCQALVVLVQGHLAYFGPPADAPAYFGVPVPAAIFPVLATFPGRAWGEKWEQSPARRAFEARRPVNPGSPT